MNDHELSVVYVLVVGLMTFSFFILGLLMAAALCLLLYTLYERR